MDNVSSTVVPVRTHSTPAAQLRQAEFEDYPLIAALLVRNGLSVPPREDWLTLWNGNPVYEARRREWPIGWVLESKSGEIVGTAGNVPLTCSFRDRTILAAAACSWAVDPRYRGYSVLLLHRLTQQKGVDLLVSTTVSPGAEPVFRMFRWSTVPAGNWAKSAFWITDHRAFTRGVLLRKTGVMATPLSFPASAALVCWEALQSRGLRAKAGNPEISLCPAFDSRFDAFWAEVKRQNRGILLPVRSRELLQWHFRCSLMSRRLWVLAATRNSRLVAYAIFDRLDNVTLGLKRVRFVDFQCLHGEEEALRPTLCWMLQRCRDEGIHCLEITGGWLDRPGFPRIVPPYTRNLASWTFYYRAKDPELAEALKEPGAWAPTSFDGDVSFDLISEIRSPNTKPKAS